MLEPVGRSLPCANVNGARECTPRRISSLRTAAFGPEAVIAWCRVQRSQRQRPFVRVDYLHITGVKGYLADRERALSDRVMAGSCARPSSAWRAPPGSREVRWPVSALQGTCPVMADLCRPAQEGAEFCAPSPSSTCDVGMPADPQQVEPSHDFGHRQPLFESSPPLLRREHRGCGLSASLFRLFALSCRCERRDT